MSESLTNGVVAQRQGMVRNGLLTIAHRNSQHERRGFESRFPRRSFSRRDAAVAKRQHIIIHLIKAGAKGHRRVRAPRLSDLLR